jgi:hypothetical protein
MEDNLPPYRASKSTFREADVADNIRIESGAKFSE